MRWTLDQEFFRRLVGLYVVAFALAILVAVYESLAPGWQDFSNEFDSLVERHFGAPGGTLLASAGTLLVVGLFWHISSLVGLRKFRPWARWSFWASMVFATLPMFVPGMIAVTFTGSLGSLTSEIGTGLFAAIVLLSYSREHGDLWFKKPLEILKETF